MSCLVEREASAYTKFDMDIVYSMTDKKATKVEIMIKSSNRTSDIKTSTHLDRHESASRGAELRIDNLTFSY